MNRSNPLSPDARRVLELGAHVEPPSSEQSDRMDRALAALFRAGRVTASGAGALGSPEQRATSPEKSAVHRRPVPPPARRSLESTLGMSAGKLCIALGALAATAAASFWLGRISTPDDSGPGDGAPRADATLVANSGAPTPGAPALSATALSAPAHSPPTRAAAAVPGSTMPDRAPAAERPRPPAQRRSPASAAQGLAAEIEQLADAEAALRRGRAQRALHLIERRSVQHLVEQAAALRVIAECDMGTAGSAQDAREVLARWPASAFQTRITRACGL